MQSWRWSRLHTGKWPKFHWFHWHQVACKIFVSFALCFCEKCQPKKLRNESRKMLKGTVKLWQHVPIHVTLQCSNRRAGVSLSLSSIYLKVPISPCKWCYLSKWSTWCFGALYKVTSVSCYIQCFQAHERTRLLWLPCCSLCRACAASHGKWWQ